MNVLAFDTATDACTVALATAAGTRVDHRVEPRAQAQTLLPAIEGLLAEADLAPTALDAIVFGRGPGNFTGLRIAVATAQGLAVGADVGLVGVSTLAAIAEGCRREHGDTRVLAMLDARMGELYVGDHLADGTDDAHDVMRLKGVEGVFAPNLAGLEALPPGAVLAGSGVRALGDALASGGAPPVRLRFTLRPERLPHALDLLALARERLALGELDPPERALPVYLRERVALTEAERGV